MKCFRFSLLIALLAISGLISPVRAQLEEPEVIEVEDPRTLLGEGIHNGLGVNILINNFGFGLRGHYSRIVGPYTELTFSAGITGIRDVREQSFRDFFTGQQIIPNKYNRALGFPFQLGVKQRLFARSVADNFRVFVAAAAGPSLAFVYPYFDDIDNSGYRNVIITEEGLQQVEPVNDFFTGWSEGESMWGVNGELKVGIDFGGNFSSLTRVEFGYFFYYYNQGIQIMEPYRAIVNQEGSIVDREPFYSDQKFFGTPQISLIFGTFW